MGYTIRWLVVVCLIALAIGVDVDGHYFGFGPRDCGPGPIEVHWGSK